MKIKVKGGTTRGGRTLCTSCKYAKSVRGQNNEEVVLCKLFASGGWGDVGPVPFKVAECSEYHPSNMPWQHEFEEMAWKIEARRRGPNGFKPDDPLEVIITPPKKGTPDEY